MKLIILAAGKSSTLAGLDEAPPVCLNHFNKTEVVLDTLTAMGQRANAQKLVLVGGYRLLDIMQARPNLSYYYDRAWQQTGSLHSLFQCVQEFDDDLIVAYSDVVHNRETAAALLAADGDVVVACDSHWKTRYEGRTARQRERAEVLIKTSLGSHRIVRASNFDPSGGQSVILGEYAGLMLFRKNVVQELAAKINSVLANEKDAGIASLLAALDMQFQTSLLDLKGQWAELDSEGDLAKFRFGTKAETLTKLKGILKLGRVLPQFTFTVNSWREHKSDVIEGITERFGNANQVVARSSAINEDTETESMAGNFESVLNVPLEDAEELESAIEMVCKSYQKNGAAEIYENQVLVQPMLQNVRASGVVFTSDLETAAPYYTIAIDRTGSTDSVTSGIGGEIQTIIAARDAQLNFDDPYLQSLIVAIKEIEQQTEFSSLDIEFAIVEKEKGGLETIILQVRPIAAHKERKKVASHDVELELKAIGKFIRNDCCQKEPLCGSTTAYGVMPDWNPAEIIGINPRPLAFSLYRHVITDRVWGASRESCGYRATFPRPGLVSLCGKPYVDVRMSFSSFTPASLDSKIADKLVNFAVGKLKDNPELHDKVEFDVMPTVFDLNFHDKLKELANAGFTEHELTAIHDAYFQLTLPLIKMARVKSELANYDELSRRRNLLIDKLTPECESRIETIQELLRDCQNYGTLPFSNLARFAFVGVIQLKSLVGRGVLSSQRYAEFLASVYTVAKQFVDDLIEMPKPELIRTYGHLRPGTYDITSLAYHDAFDQYIDLDNRPKSESHAEFELNDDESKGLSEALADSGIDITPSKLLDFIRAAIQGRELGKFEFSRNLSLAIDLIAELGEEFGFSREEISFLEINDILELASKTIPANLTSQWTDVISLHRRQHSVSCAIKLPELISSERDIWSFTLGATKPNFITQKTIIAPTVDVSSNPPTSLDGKICLIENADPGFDWIFSHRIAGLITAYGGANSHMAIRCAEFEIPAAVGCGNALYRTLLSSNRVRLDCPGMTIEMLP